MAHRIHRVHRAMDEPGLFARSVAQTLREVRQKRGITQAEAVRLLAAEGVPLHRSTLSRIELTKADMLMSEFFALCAVYQIDVDTTMIAAELRAKGARDRPLSRTSASRRVKA